MVTIEFEDDELEDTFDTEEDVEDDSGDEYL